MDKAGDTTLVDGVRGGGGGEATTALTLALAFPSAPTMARACVLALSSASASQKALCVIKLSLLIHNQTRASQQTRSSMKKRKE
jgi:hypothetical protein